MFFGVGVVLYPLLCGLSSLLEPVSPGLSLSILQGNSDILYAGKVARAVGTKRTLTALFVPIKKVHLFLNRK